MIAACAAATAVAAWLVRYVAPQAEGSGIPHVEAVVSGALPPAPWRLLPVKFVGGCSPSARVWPWGAKGPRCKWGRAWPSCGPGMPPDRTGLPGAAGGGGRGRSGHGV